MISVILLVAVAGSTPASASPDEKSGILVVDPTQDPGTVLVQGEITTDGECDLPPLGGVGIGEFQIGVVIEVMVTSACEVILSGSCIDQIRDCPLVPNSISGGVAVPFDVLPGDDTEISTNCDAAKGVRGELYTYGYGGKGDRLTQVEREMTFWPGCSHGNVDAQSAGGACRWTDWNGWENHLCQGYRSGTPDGCPSGCGDHAEMGMHGDFSCDNWNFCRNNHFEHTLKLEVEGYHNGDAWCTWRISGDLPPQAGSGHKKDIICVWTDPNTASGVL